MAVGSIIRLMNLVGLAMLMMKMMMALAGIMMINSDDQSGGVWVQQQQQGCLDDVQALDQCVDYFSKRGPERPPSEACCRAVKAADIPCVCQYAATPKALEVINVGKVAFVAKACGRPLPLRFKCGSLTLPTA